MEKKLTPLLGKFPVHFIIIFYSTELGAVRIRFHPTRSGNAAFYRQMMDLLNSNL
jgi:hypothetical protein